MVGTEDCVSYSIERSENLRGFCARLYPGLKWRQMNRVKRWRGQAGDHGFMPPLLDKNSISREALDALALIVC